MGFARYLSRLALALTFALLVPQASAQEGEAEDDAVVQIILEDGSRMVGTIQEETPTSIRFRTVSGVVMDIPRDQIVRIQPREGTPETGRYATSDPNRTRLLFAPTGRSLNDGEGYVAVYEIFFPFVSYGLADRLILSGGVSLIPGADGQLLYAAPKLTLLQRRDLTFAAGGIVAGITSEEGLGGVLFGVATAGSSERAVTIGAGFGFGGGEFEETPVLLIGGELQVSNNIKLLSENYVLPGVDGVVLVSGGIRFFGERLAADFGLFTSPELIDEGGFPFLPWVGFAYNFGR